MSRAHVQEVRMNVHEVEELMEIMRQAPDRLWMADLVGQKISVERMRDILTFALAQQGGES